MDYLLQQALQRLTQTPWAIQPAALTLFSQLIDLRISSGDASVLDVEALRGAGFSSKPAQAVTSGGVAVLGLRGIIRYRGDPLMEFLGLGGNSLQQFMARFRAALADPDIVSIVIDIDSPGGSTDGVPEAAAEILAARGQKPIVAIANTHAASAAYWLAAAADELIVTPSSEVGSIGVFTMHKDMSAALAEQGVKVTLISAGQFKTEGHPFGPLSDEALAAIQAKVDQFYGLFVSAVAKGRGVKASAVRSGFGEGRSVLARDAVGAGMADRVATLDETVMRLQRGNRRTTPRRSAEDFRFSFH